MPRKSQSAKDEDPGNPTINFRGEKRRNDTHQSTTDPESVLYRKANGKEAKLCFGAHLLMENRNGLCADFTLAQSHRRAGAGGGLATIGRAPETASGRRAQEPWGRQELSPERFCRAAAGSGRLRRTWRAKKKSRSPAWTGAPRQRGLSSQSKHSQTGRGNHWLDQGDRRIEAQPVSGNRTHASLGLLCGGHLQSAADGATGTGRLVKAERANG